MALLASINHTSALADTTRAGPALFGTTEVRSANLKAFPKWTDMLARHFAEENRGDPPCRPSAMNACAVQAWKAFVAQTTDRQPLRVLDAVNRHMNAHRYILDIVNYGQEDYWATPREFVVNDGDCEDFAIAKYMTLKLLGWKEQDLRIVILQDVNLRAAHAVLAVYLEGEIYILDNQIKQVVKAETIRHYKPFYSINEGGWWLHR